MAANALRETMRQLRFEAAIILMLSNIALGFVLISSVQTAISKYQSRYAHTILPPVASAAPAAQTLAASEPSPAAAAPAAKAHIAAAAIPAGSTVWPLRGRVTTEFGVPEPPYEPIHTGIDISSGRRAGVMPVTPFEKGTVVQVIHSNRGLGNHVIVDQGGGLTSYYCHLNSISVHLGQAVKPGDILGYEGRTGVVTGTHLHFEIRRGSTPLNPRSFIAGSPG